MLDISSSKFVEFIHIVRVTSVLGHILCKFKGMRSSILRCDHMPQVRNLQRQLQEEIDMHLALTDAIAHDAELILKSSTKLPNKVCTHQRIFFICHKHTYICL